MRRDIVAKFGGTSVETSSAIKHVASTIADNPQIRVVILSAVRGVTDLLVTLAHASSKQRQALASRIVQIHLDIAEALGLSLEYMLKDIYQKLEDSCTDRPYNAKERDELLSIGEDLSSAIVYSYLKQQALQVVRIDARDFIVTDDTFGKASADVASIRTQFSTLPQGICVMQGFVGATSQRRTTTLGRGGSDYSAALVAEAIEAKELLIYTDVPGVYTMDPNLLPTAKQIKSLSFQEMAEMAYFGAKILHPATLRPCIRSRTPVRILSTFKKEKGGTSISPSDDTSTLPYVRAIAMRRSQILVTIKSLKMISAYGFLATIFNILSRSKISVDLVTTSEASVALTVDGTTLTEHENPFTKGSVLLQDLGEVAEVVVEEGLTLLAVVGSGLTVPGMIQKIFAQIEENKLRLICYGASGSSIGILVPEEETLQTVEKLHKKLIEESKSIAYTSDQSDSQDHCTVLPALSTSANKISYHT